MSSDALWRLRIRDLSSDDRPGAVRGAGFAVTEHEAITCAHLAIDAECWAETLEEEQAAQRCRVERSFGRPGDDEISKKDIAIVHLPAAVQGAPLGPRTPPSVGAELEVVGFPYGDSLALAERTRVRVVGMVTNGLVQVNTISGYSPVVETFSGSAAVDVRSGRVVGMVIGVDNTYAPVWLIPLTELARSWKKLDGLLPRGLSVDPEFKRAVDDLGQGSYGYALTRLNSLQGSYPGEPDLAYYRVLAALRGRRPGALSRSAVDEILALLAPPAGPTAGAPHVAALAALTYEDYYVLRGLDPRRRDARLPEGVTALRAREITTHVQAPECSIWQALYARSM